MNPYDRKPFLRAEGNLTYIEFIKLLKFLWNRSHPDVPLFPMQGPNVATYPSIVYSLELRATHPDEPKAKYREEIVEQDGQRVLVYGRRFQNVISFTAVSKHDTTDIDSFGVSAPEEADALIEEFEDFMLTQIPVFKRLGASELVYSRRVSDTEENRGDTDVSKRTVHFMLTTEKVMYTPVEVLNETIIRARTWQMSQQEIDPDWEEATPATIPVDIQDYNTGDPDN